MCRLFLAVLVALFSTTFTVHAWTASSAASSFGGKSLVTGANIKSHSSSIVVLQNGSTTVMKKGKANVQPEMRGQQTTKGNGGNAIADDGCIQTG